MGRGTGERNGGQGRARRATPLLLAALAACGGGGGTAGGSGTGGAGQLTGTLQILERQPADGAVQVPLRSQVRVRFDGAIAPDALQDPDTRLVRAADGAPVRGSLTLDGGGRTLVFTPDQDLAAETDYAFHVAPLLADIDGRLLDTAETASGFRTLDQEAPTVLGCSVTANATQVARTVAPVVTFREAMDPASLDASSVKVRDAFGDEYAAVLTLAGDRLTIDPVADLAGNRRYTLSIRGGTTGARDRSGNLLATTWTLSFTTATDLTPPRALRGWPADHPSASPLVQPTFWFDESIDPYSVETASVLFVDQYSGPVAYEVVTTPDRRTLRLVPKAPLASGRTYSVVLLPGPGAVTDLSGNPLVQELTLSFTVGSDATAPGLASSAPRQDEGRVPVNARVTLGFTEALDPSSVDVQRVQLRKAGATVGVTVSRNAADTVLTLVPDENLAPASAYEVLVRGGSDGLRDVAGNPLASDVLVRFTTASDAILPDYVLAPYDAAVNVPLGARVSAVFTTPLDPASVGPGSVQVLDPQNQLVPGVVALERGGRVVRFTPAAPWAAGAWHTIRIAGGFSGIRTLSGNALADDAISRFRAGFTQDSSAPFATVTLNRVAALRKQGLSVPPFAFTVDVEAGDPVDYSLDIAATELLFAGPGAVPDAEAIATTSEFGMATVRWAVPYADRFAPGEYTVRARVRDLSGNSATSDPLTFRVVAPDHDALPFERSHVVWVRLDLDRDGNGRADFEDDLLALGLVAAGDPSGTNARMLALMRDGVLAEANRLLHRTAQGAPLGGESVSLRLTHRRPYGIPHAQIAFGGADPEGTRGRRYGDASTGILGRAYFDYRNSSITDLNLASRPGLGVFPFELFLNQAELHRAVYPSFITTFARRFLNVCPQMGGTAAGADPNDRMVLAPGFDYATASPAQRARYLAVMSAADDWAVATAIVLAHEIGHTVGLVAEGPNPRGLHGDRSLHNEFAGATDVMAAAVGYDALVTLAYAFRDLDLAYLRQRVLLK